MDNIELNSFQQVKSFDKYVNEVENYVLNTSSLKVDYNKIRLILDGEASENSKKIIPLESRREFGIFFTDSKISSVVGQKINEIKFKRIIDPCLGVGNLLLACAKNLSFKATHGSHELINEWSKILYGNDIHATFVKLSKLRLSLLASLLTNDFSCIRDNVYDYFQNIKTMDFWKTSHNYSSEDAIVINPPFGYGEANNTFNWANGRIQVAATYIDTILSHSEIGAEIIAILPDVLRSGSLYKKWREVVSKKAEIKSCEILGKFDSKTDVDVFLLHLRRKDSNNANSFFTDFSEFSENKFRIEDFFDIKVGPVVPFRLENKGNWYPFVNCSKTNWWDRNLNFSKIRFNGKVFKPPFVVIRRTSSPSENYRAIAAIITGKENIAVENHLLVLMPKDNKIETCRELMVRLKDKRTNDWLNNRIRCRHLTVSSVSKLPWWE